MKSKLIILASLLVFGILAIVVFTLHAETDNDDYEIVFSEEISISEDNDSNNGDTEIDDAIYARDRGRFERLWSKVSFVYSIEEDLERDYDLLANHVEFLNNHHDLSFIITAEDLDVTHLVFSWTEFITEEQFNIVREYLNIAPGEFRDQLILDYMDILTEPNPDAPMSGEEMRYYDSIPIDEMPDNPRRILVRMYEAWAVIHLEARDRFLTEQYGQGLLPHEWTDPILQRESRRN